jgi:hypothetical protein
MSKAIIPAIAVLALVSAPAAAQDTDQQFISAFGAPLPSSPEDKAFVQEFGTCAAGSQQFYAKDVLRSLPASGPSDKALFWMVMSSNSCGNGKTYNFNPRALRGPVVESYLKRDFDLNAWKSKRSPLKTFAMPTIGELEKLSADQRAGVVMLAVGACVFKAAPAHVGALLRTSVSSPEEGAAVAALAQPLSTCVPAGSQLKVTKFQLRGYLAEAAYRSAAAPSEGR